jgi:hypothetical protein
MRCPYFIGAFLTMALNLACQTASVKSLSEVNSNSNAAVQQTKDIDRPKITSNPIKEVQPVKDKDKRKLDVLLTNMIQSKSLNYEESFKELNTAVDKNLPNKTYITMRVLDKVIQICNDENSINSIDDMNALKLLANILADFQTVEALDTLIVCSDHRHPVGGLSYFNYPTVPAIIKYKEKAYPYLEKKLLSSDVNSEIKCNIVAILADKGSWEGEKILMIARKTETKQMAKYCIEQSLR